MAKFLVLCLLAGQAFAAHNDIVLDTPFNSGAKVRNGVYILGHILP